MGSSCPSPRNSRDISLHYFSLKLEQASTRPAATCLTDRRGTFHRPTEHAPPTSKEHEKRVKRSEVHVHPDTHLNRYFYMQSQRGIKRRRRRGRQRHRRGSNLSSYMPFLSEKSRTSDLRSRSTLCGASARLRVLKKVLPLNRFNEKICFSLLLCSLIRTFAAQYG